jgi:hypothetical protein
VYEGSSVSTTDPIARGAHDYVDALKFGIEALAKTGGHDVSRALLRELSTRVLGLLRAEQVSQGSIHADLSVDEWLSVALVALSRAAADEMDCERSAAIRQRAAQVQGRRAASSMKPCG